MKVEEWAPPTAVKVREMWREVSDELISARRDDALNRAFVSGQQYLSWNRADATATVVDFRDQIDAETRVTVNHFRTRVNRMIARLVRQDLQFEVDHSDVGLAASRRQRLSQAVLMAEHRARDWETIREAEVKHMLYGGTAAIAVEYDPTMQVVPVFDELSGEKRMTTGVKLSALSISEFGIEPGSRTETDALWWIRATTLTPAQAQRRYSLPTKPEADGKAVQTPLASTLRRGGGDKSVCVVYVYYERPTATTPGCVVHVVGDHVETYEWPFPFRELNIAIYLQSDTADRWFGDTVLNDARPIQVAYNRARSTMQAHVRRAANARLLVAEGSIDDFDNITDETGEVLTYRADVAGGQPSWMSAPEVPRWLAAEPGNTLGEMDEVFSSHAVTRGEAPGDRNSGLALSILAEKDDTPLGPMARSQQRGWQRVGRLYLQAVRGVVGQGQSIANLKTEDGTPISYKWSADDIDESPNVHVPLDSVAPRSQSATRAELAQLATTFPALAQLSIENVTRLTGTTGLADVGSRLDPVAAKARRENDLLLALADLNDVPIPDDWDDHAKHIDIHNQGRDSLDYDNASPEQQAAIDQHVAAHAKMLADQMQAQQPVEPGGMPPEMGAPPGEVPSMDMPMEAPQ